MTDLPETFTLDAMMSRYDADRLLTALGFVDKTHPNSTPGHRYWIGRPALEAEIRPMDRMGAGLCHLTIGPR